MERNAYYDDDEVAAAFDAIEQHRCEAEQIVRQLAAADEGDLHAVVALAREWVSYS